MVKNILNKINNKNQYKEYERYSKILSTIESYDHKDLCDYKLLERFEKIDNFYERIAIIKEAMYRTIGIDLYSEQICATLAMLDNNVIDMKTGEGKTFVIAAHNIIEFYKNRYIYVATVTDYLAKRDYEILKPFYDFFKIDVSYVINEDRRAENIVSLKDKYRSRIVYSTYRGLVIDYLQSSLGKKKEFYFQKIHDKLVIDEIDSILIDEATEPVYLSTYTKKSNSNYKVINDLVKNNLKEEHHFNIDREKNLIDFTESGIERIEKILSIDNLYSNDNIIYVPMIEQAIRAIYTLENGKDYIVENNRIILLDDYGRKNYNSKFSEGLQQACEAKEDLKISPMIEPLSKMSYQSYFKLFNCTTGCSGSVETEKNEFKNIYNLNIVSIPTHLPITRKDLEDLIFVDREAKFNGLIKDMEKYRKKGQPILIICSNINESKTLSRKLRKLKISHNYLDGSNSFKEGKIIEESGKYGKVTVIANLAGRGVDIKTDYKVDEIGGLVVYGLSKQNSERQDNQIRGRTGRQGKPGISQFFLSMEDDIIKVLDNKKIKSIFQYIDIDSDKPIISNMISNMFKTAQENIEAINREFRLNSIEYDKVYEEQRKIYFRFRKDMVFDELNMQQFLQKGKNLFYKEIYNELFYNSDEDSREKYKVVEDLFLNRYNISLDLKNIDNSVWEDETLFEKFITEIVNTIFKVKFKDFTKEEVSLILKELSLPIIDHLWSKHIQQLDLLQTGINWRSMTMKDPLSEFKKDSYYEFENLLERVKLEIFKVIIKTQFKRE